MRHSFFIFLASLLMLQPLHAAPTNLELSPDQENRILSSLNNICGDTWCSGEYNLNFSSIKFREEFGSQHYVIGLLVQNSYDDKAETRQLSCNLEDLQLIQQLVHSDGSFSHEVLEQQLYQEVNNCLVAK